MTKTANKKDQDLHIKHLSYIGSVMELPLRKLCVLHGEGRYLYGGMKKVEAEEHLSVYGKN